MAWRLRGHLPPPVIAVAKSGWTLDQLRARAQESIERSGGLNRDAFNKFVAVLSYIDGDYSDISTFQQLADALGGSNYPAHYLAIPPRLFGLVFRQLALSGASRSGRVIVEKPFGHELATARELNHVMHGTFDEERTSTASITTWGKMPFRTSCSSDSGMRSWSRSGTGSSSRTCRSRWRRNSASMAEDRSTTRPAPSGDVVQNHLLQLLTNVAMEPPPGVDPELARDERVKVLKGIATIQPGDVIRGQFRGYRNEGGVSPSSTVETYAAMKLSINSWRWKGVPFYIRAGKRMATTSTEVIVWLRQAPAVFTPAPPPANYFRFQVNADADHCDHIVRQAARRHASR